MSENAIYLYIISSIVWRGKRKRFLVLTVERSHRTRSTKGVQTPMEDENHCGKNVYISRVVEFTDVISVRAVSAP